ncbi:UNVERIFIED_CONTAM: hypothetical protein RMT77_004760 [Armadillidium vulgare]
MQITDTIKTVFILYYYLLTDIASAASSAHLRKCYRCLVQEGCISLNIYADNVTKTCPKGVDHCVISRTTSKVTGAIATDYLCGGRVYDVEKPSIKDGCFEGTDDPAARTHRTVCYCSSDLCNGTGKMDVPVITLLLCVIFYNYPLLT